MVKINRKDKAKITNIEIERYHGPLITHGVSLGYIFVNIIGLGLAGAWYAVFIDQFIRWLIILFRFKSGKWKNIRISLD